MDPLIVKLALALAIGLLVGLERGWQEREAPEGSRTAGIRTYGISGLLGGLVAALGQAAGNIWLLPVGLSVFGLTFSWFKWHESTHDEDFSFTGVVAALAVFVLGAIAVVGEAAAAAAGGAALAALLASRDMLHGLLRRISWIELRSAVVLAAMTTIVLPLLPDRAIDPWGAVNPREVWVFTVLAAALSYLGYIAIRLFGSTRGLLLGCIAGSLISSTAMTLSYARDAKAGGRPRVLAGAAAIAAMVSVLRVLLFVAVLSSAIFAAVAPAALAAAAVFGLSGTLLLSGVSDQDLGEKSQRNPFDLLPLLVFALLFAVVAVASTLSATYFGAGSLVATAALSGTVDVDVAVLSMLHLVGKAYANATIAAAILAALASNAIVRFLVAAAAGPARFALPLLLATLLSAGAGTLAFLFVPAF